MSSERGNVSRTRPQRHQNTRAFRNDKYDTSARRKKINAKLHDGVCQHCKDILEWRVKFSKYKLLSKPKKCFWKENTEEKQLLLSLLLKMVEMWISKFPTLSVCLPEQKVKLLKDDFLRTCFSVKCLLKTVKDPYHIICRPCAGKLEVCAKCGKQEIVIPIDKGGQEDRTDSETAKNSKESSGLEDELDFDTNFNNADSDEDSDVLEEQFKNMNFKKTNI